MGDIEKAVKKYLGEKELIFRGEYEIEGIKAMEEEADAALFINTIDEDALELLNNGGKLLVAVPNRDWYVNHPSGKDWHKEGDEYVLEEWKFNFEKNVLWKRMIIPDRVDQEEEIETFTPAHLKVLLETYGLRTLSIFSDVDKDEYTPTKPVLFGFAEKRERRKRRRRKVEEVQEVPKEEEVIEEVKEEPELKVEEEVVKIPEEVRTVPVVTETREREPVEKEYEESYNLKLTWRDSNNKIKEMEVEEDVVIGRGRGDTLTMRTTGEKKKYSPMMLFDPKKRISRRHIEIVNMDGKWVLRDVGSTNGTKINGTLLPGWKKPKGGNRYPSEYVELNDGDMITLADIINLNVVLERKRELKESVNEEVVKEVFGEIERGEVEEEIPRVSKPAPSPPPTPAVEEEIEVPCLLKWVDGNFRPHEVEITDDVYIGKRKDNVVFLKTRGGKITIPLGIIDTENEISERQLEIHRENGKWFLRDLGSEKGTILNGKILPGWDKSGRESEYVEIKDDDEILIGRYLITVKLK